MFLLATIFSFAGGGNSLSPQQVMLQQQDFECDNTRTGAADYTDAITAASFNIPPGASVKFDLVKNNVPDGSVLTTVPQSEVCKKFKSVYDRTILRATLTGNIGTSSKQDILCKETGGTFQLIYKQQKTTQIPFNAASADVQTALRDLSTVHNDTLVAFTEGSIACTAAGTNTMKITFGSKQEEAKISSTSDKVVVTVEEKGANPNKYGRLTVKEALSNVKAVYPSCLIEAKEEGEKMWLLLTFVILAAAMEMKRLAVPGTLTMPHNGAVNVLIHAIVCGACAWYLGHFEGYYKHGPCKIGNGTNDVAEDGRWIMFVLSLILVMVYIVTEVGYIFWHGYSDDKFEWKWGFTDDVSFMWPSQKGDGGEKHPILRGLSAFISIFAVGWVAVTALDTGECTMSVTVFYIMVSIALLSAYNVALSENLKAKGKRAWGWTIQAIIFSILVLGQILTWVDDHNVLGADLKAGCHKETFENPEGAQIGTWVTLLLYIIVSVSYEKVKGDPIIWRGVRVEGMRVKPAAGMAGERLTQDNPRRGSMQFV